MGVKIQGTMMAADYDTNANRASTVWPLFCVILYTHIYNPKHGVILKNLQSAINQFLRDFIAQCNDILNLDKLARKTQLRRTEWIPWC